MSTTTTPTRPARTVDQMKQSMYQHYGVWVSHIGEDGDMLALGHHEPKRVIAALNRHCRQTLGLINLADETWPSYRDVASTLEWRHARLVTDCGDTDDPDHDEDCWQCREIRDSAWYVNYSMPAGLELIPVTIWRT